MTTASPLTDTDSLPTFRLDVLPQQPAVDSHLVNEAHSLGLSHLSDLRRNAFYLVRGEITADQAASLGQRLLADPINRTNRGHRRR